MGTHLLQLGQSELNTVKQISCCVVLFGDGGRVFSQLLFWFCDMRAKAFLTFNLRT